MAAPANDLFADAQLLSGSLGMVSGTTVDATMEVGETDPNAYYAWPEFCSVWYKWTAPLTGVARFSTGLYKTKLALYTGTALENLSPVSFKRYGTAEYVTSGTTYYIWIATETSVATSFTLTWEAIALEVFSGPIYKTLPARLNPFPFDDFFMDTRGGDWSAISQVYNNPDNDAAMLNVRFGGYMPSWEHPQASYAVGLIRSPNDTASIPFAQRYLYSGEPMFYDTWGTGYRDQLNLRVLSRYIEPNQSYGNGDGPVLSNPNRSYPGVCGIALYENDSYTGLAPVWLNAPISFEAWFSENPYKKSPHRFTGYTIFGDQDGYVSDPFSYYATPTTGTYLRRFVHGVIKRTANLETCTISDIMCGWLFEYVNEKSVVDLVINGVSKFHYETTERFNQYDGNSFFGYIDTAWRGTIETYAGTPVGTLRSIFFGVQGPPDAVQSPEFTSYIGEYNDPWYQRVDCYDTYDVKWGWYYDLYAPTLPVGTVQYDSLGRPLCIDTQTPSMMTYPGRDYGTTSAPEFWQTLINTREET